MGMAKYDAKHVKEINPEDINLIGTERTNYFEGIGKNVQKATSLETAIALSGLDFTVSKRKDAFIEEKAEGDQIIKVYHEIPNSFSTVRDDNLTPLGHVGKNYHILQNVDAFNFLDSMVGEAKFETAGLYGKFGEKSFITMSTEPMQIMGDEFKPYILFTNTFDGSGSVRVMFTPIRVFCSNCLTLAIKRAVNKVCIKHSSRLESRLSQAKEILLDNTSYMNALKEEAERLALIPYTDDQFKTLATSLFVTKEDDSPLAKARNEALINSLMTAYNQDDLQNYNNTAYKVIQAFSDWESHKPSLKNTKTIDYKNLNTVIDGMAITNMIANRIMASVA